MEFRQLLPGPGRLSVEQALDVVAPMDREPPPGRPRVLVNFISTVDGRATFAGRSGALGDDGDRALFHGLRERVDAVMVGTQTMRVEGYGRMLGKPERRERRMARGLNPEPLACVVSRTGDLPLEIPLFHEPEARVIVFSAVELELDVAAQVEVVHLAPEKLTPTTAMRRLRRDHRVSLLLCEGGPVLFGSLLREGLVDELLLTLAPKLSGGGHAPAITSGDELAELANLVLLSVLEREGSLFLRYALSDGAQATRLQE